MIKESPRIVKTCEKVSKIAIYFLVFLLPIFFLPWTVNVLDFNKQTLLIVLVFVSLFAWLLKILISGKFSFNLSWIHIPVVVLFLVFLVSTIFSNWRYGSFWGWPQNTSESLFTLLGFILLYFLVINIFERKEIFRLMVLFGFSSFLAILYGIVQLFGKFILPFDFTKATSFNTIDSVNGLAVFTAVLLPFFITILTISTKKILKILFILGLILSAASLVIINFPVAWWALIFGSALLIVFGTQKRDVFDSRWLALPMFFLALSLFFTFFKFQIPGLPDRPIEVSLTQKAGFNISLKTLKESPILGSGPGTFIYDFSKHKDINFNQSPLWSIRFEKTGSKVLTTLATTGILGTLSFLALIGLFILYGIKSIFSRKPEKTKDEGLLWNIGFGVFISLIAITFVFFFYDPALTLNFVYFLLIAAFISLFSQTKKEFLLKPSSLFNLVVTFALTIIFISGLGLLIFEGQRYAAEMYYLKGVRVWQEGKADEATGFLKRAANINPRSDLYWRELSQVYLQDINITAVRTDLSREELTQKIQTDLSSTVNFVKAATDSNPKNVANWSVRGFIYQNLIGIVGGTKEWSVNSYDEALKLEPTNPYFPTQAGISLLKEANILVQDKTEEKEENILRAQELFRKAIELKTDYAPAHFQLAIVYQLQGRQSEMAKELEKARESAPFDIGLAFQLGVIYYQNKDYPRARDELERAVLNNPDYANALYFLGLTYDQLGQREQAVEKFKKVAALNPDNQEVQKILENLKAGRNALERIVEKVPPTVPIEKEHPELEE